MTDRAVYGTRKHRAEDIVKDDVVRNTYGKWDVVSQPVVKSECGRYVTIPCEAGGGFTVRTVHLVDVQVAKPS